MHITLALDPQDCNETLPSIAAFAPTEPEQVGKAVFELFEVAVSHRLRWPKIHLQVGWRTVVIKRAGKRSRYCGQILITDDVKWPDSTWYGRIDESGTLYPGRALGESPDVYRLLVRFAVDPAGLAIEQGQLYGNCIFCRKRLSDPRATGHGYGEQCAANYGLRWDADRKMRGLYKDVLEGVERLAWSAA